MRRLQLHLIAILAAMPIGAAAGQAQGTTTRGVTRLDSGGLRLLHGRAASYPDAARISGIEGTVVVEVSLDAKGHVIDAHVVSGPNELRAAALRSILEDHFAGDGNASRQVRLSVVFTLQKIAAATRATAATPDLGSPPPAIAAIDCPVLPTDLCKDVRQRLAASVGSPLTPEKRAEILQSITDLDDHLQMETSKAPNGVQVLIWIQSSIDIPPGIVGGLAPGFQFGAPAPAPPPPPPPAPARAPVRTGSTAKAPTKIKDVKPIYPQIAKNAGVQGVVIVEIVIGADGSVQQAKILRSLPLLDAAALDAVRQWQYEPTTIDGAAVPVTITAPITFTLPKP